jgi:feruloyl esterase
LIMCHGWIDQNIAPRNSISYYGNVVATMAGNGGGNFNPNNFIRLFMVPGMQHCSGGPGPNTFDSLGALDQWVEQGIPADKIIGSNTTSGLSRPLCPYLHK